MNGAPSLAHRPDWQHHLGVSMAQRAGEIQRPPVLHCGEVYCYGTGWPMSEP